MEFRIDGIKASPKRLSRKSAASGPFDFAFNNLYNISGSDASRGSGVRCGVSNGAFGPDEGRRLGKGVLELG